MLLSTWLKSHLKEFIYDAKSCVSEFINQFNLLCWIIFYFILLVFNIFSSSFNDYISQFDLAGFRDVIIGIITIYITIAVAIFSINRSAKHRAKFDLLIIFNEVLKFRKIAITLIFSLLFFALVQQKSLNDIKILCFIVIAYASTNAFLKPLQHIYEYIAGDKSQFEFTYLKRVVNKPSSDNEKLVRALDSFWDGRIEYNENLYLELFTQLVANNLNQKNYMAAYALLNSFYKPINKRNFYHLLQNFYPKLLGWHLNFFVEAVDSNDRNINGYYEVNSVIQDLFYNILDKSVLEDYGHSFHICIGLFKKHIDAQPAPSVFANINKKNEYLREYFDKYFNNLLKNFNQNAFNGTDVWGKNSTTIKEWQFSPENMISNQSIAFNIFCLFKNWLLEKIDRSTNLEEFANTGLLIHYIFREQDPEVMKTFFIYFYLKLVKYKNEVDQVLLNKINAFSRSSVPVAYSGLTENFIEKQKKQSQSFELIDAILRCDKNISEHQSTQIQKGIRTLLDKNLVWHNETDVNNLLLDFIEKHY